MANVKISVKIGAEDIFSCGYRDVEKLNEYLTICDIFRIYIDDVAGSVERIGNTTDVNTWIYSAIDMSFWEILRQLEEYIEDEVFLKNNPGIANKLDDILDYIDDLRDNFTPFVNYLDSHYNNILDYINYDTYDTEKIFNQILQEILKELDKMESL